MKKLFVSILVLFAFIIGAIVVLPVVVPTDLIRDQLIRTVKNQTGRDLVIKGETSFALFPKIGVKLRDVTLSNPPGMGNGPTLAMRELDVSVQLWPLLRREIAVDRFVLRHPVINLHIDGRGRKSWDFAHSTTPNKSFPASLRFALIAPAHAHQSDQGDAATSAGSGFRLRNLQLRQVKIIDGTVNYSDARTGVAHTVKKLNLTATQASPTAPLHARGDLVWRHERVDFDMKLPALITLNEQGGGPVQATLSTPFSQTTFKGSIATRNGLTLKARTKAQSQALGALAGWLAGTPSPALQAVKTASITGDLIARPQNIAFTGATLKLADMTATGDIAVDLKGPRPFVHGVLKADKINLSHFTRQQAAHGGHRRQGRPVKLREGDSIGRMIGSLDTEVQPQPRHRQAAAGRTWSRQPLGLEGLNAIDAELRLETGSIIHNKIKTGRGVVELTLNRGRAETLLQRLDLYQGTAKGRLIVNARQARPSLRIALTLDGVNARPLLRDAADLDWLSGTGNFQFELNGIGRSQYEIISSLGGRGRLAFLDGAIEGIDIAKALRNFDPAQFSGIPSRNSHDKTHFTSLTSEFTVRNGRIRLPKGTGLVMKGPLLRMRGNGVISLPDKTLDINVRPKLVASVEGQGGADDLSGIEIPVRLVGPWEAPRPKVDLNRLLEGADRNINSVQDLKKALKGLKKGNIGNLLGGLLGGGQTESGTAPGAENDAGSSIGKALDSIFKNQGSNANPSDSGETPPPDAGEVLKELFR